MPKITLYVDIVSPFAYIAYYVLRHDPVFKKCEITYIPIFLGGIMKTAGNTPPINIKNKDKWIAAERIRWARYFHVPIVPETPANFPPNTLAVMRAICAGAAAAEAGAGAGAGAAQSGPPMSSPAAQALLTRALDAFYDAYWVRGRVITDGDVIADVLGAVLWGGGSSGSGSGSSGAKDDEAAARVLEAAGGEGKRLLLLRNTERAFAEGAFGLPWMVCESDGGEREGFWGCDHLGCVVDFLGLGRPGAASWRAML